MTPDTCTKNCVKILIGLILIFGSSAVFSKEDTRDSKSPFGVLDFLAWDHARNDHKIVDRLTAHDIKILGLLMI
ncbi:MAG: hypothetical protein AUJ71_00930 [Candidatus Omnitrophica bacterium CG1_02_49_16]|nr:MAG: hypothetical protein AUJ71_00930 [Candidatus Omnitrophica bacterium CG1_02_49_16]